ncbi:MAG: hypothetical protein ACXVEF_01980 [Polyangiales bacterium]
MILVLALLAADLHADGYAINVAPKNGTVCVVLPEGRNDADCAGIDLGKLRTRASPGLAIVRHGASQYEVSLERVVQKDLGSTSAEDLKKRGDYELVTIAASPAARFVNPLNGEAIVYEVPSDDRALRFTFRGTAPEMRAEAESMVHSIVRPHAELTLYGKPLAEQEAFRKKYASAFERTHLAVRIAAWLTVAFVLLLGFRIWKQRRR